LPASPPTCCLISSPIIGTDSKTDCCLTWTDSVRNCEIALTRLKVAKTIRYIPSKPTQLRKNGEASRRFPAFSAYC
jgi:hypothetical protein